MYSIVSRGDTMNVEVEFRKSISHKRRKNPYDASYYELMHHFSTAHLLQLTKYLTTSLLHHTTTRFPQSSSNRLPGRVCCRLIVCVCVCACQCLVCRIPGSTTTKRKLVSLSHQNVRIGTTTTTTSFSGSFGGSSAITNCESRCLRTDLS
jgi:hypothetical protein